MNYSLVYCLIIWQKTFNNIKHHMSMCYIILNEIKFGLNSVILAGLVRKQRSS